MSTAAYDVVIVGAGIVGAACADEFARRGMRVAVVDRDVVGSGATAAGMGHIVVMDDSEAQFALTRYSQQLWQALRTELPAEVEYDQSGTIWSPPTKRRWSRSGANTTSMHSAEFPRPRSTRRRCAGSNQTCAMVWQEA